MGTANTPLYRRIADDLRAAIRDGELPPGAQLPTEPELEQQYGVSRNTVRLAIALLVNEGLLDRAPRRGTTVRETATLTYYATRAESAERPAREPGDAFVDEVRGQGRQPTQTFELQLVPAAVEVASRLRLDENATTVLRRLLRYVDGRPWSIQNSYYPVDIAEQAGLTEPQNIPEGTVRRMAAHGHIEVGYIDEIATRMPTPDETQFLQLSVGVPVLVYARTTYTDVRPLRLTMTTFAGDRNRLVYELGKLQAVYDNREPA